MGHRTPAPVFPPSAPSLKAQRARVHRSGEDQASEAACPARLAKRCKRGDRANPTHAPSVSQSARPSPAEHKRAEARALCIPTNDGGGSHANPIIRAYLKPLRHEEDPAAIHPSESKSRKEERHPPTYSLAPLPISEVKGPADSGEPTSTRLPSPSLLAEDVSVSLSWRR